MAPSQLCVGDSYASSSCCGPANENTEMDIYSSDRLLHLGAGIGVIGIILIWTRVGPFWVGGVMIAAGSAFSAAHYVLGAIPSPSMIGRRLRRVVCMGAAALAFILLLGLLWASAISAMNLSVSGAEKTLAKALPFVGILFGVFVAVDFVLEDREG